MGRLIRERLLVAGHLVAQAPLHVGGRGDDPLVDLPLARNGRDEVYVPGTSLAGPLRAWCFVAFGEDSARALWGFQERDSGHASMISLADAPVPRDYRPELRDGVGIDRWSGAAADGIKFDRAVLPKGTRLDFRLTVDLPDGHGLPAGARIDPGVAAAIVGHLVTALEGGDIRLGAASTRGLGRVRLERRRILSYDLAAASGVLGLLAEQGSEVSPDDLRARAQAVVPLERPRAVITIGWRPDGPLMVKAGHAGNAADSLPLTGADHTGDESRIHLVLPGSSVKGALRAQAERIVRTLRRIDVSPGPPRQGFNSQVDVPLVRDLFGAGGPPKDAPTGGASTPVQTRRGRGALAVADSYASRGFTEADWRAVERAPSDRELRATLGKLSGTPTFTNTYHVAIDRWLGSVADQKLFTVLEPEGSEWPDLEIEIDFARLEAGDRAPAFALALLVLRDLKAGRIPLGYATNRGMGSIAVDRVDIKCHGFAGLPPEADAVARTSPVARSLDVLVRDLGAELDACWHEWIARRGE